MPELNPDILRDIFYEIIKKDGSFENIDKFMMAGKEPFNLVLDICKKSNSIIVFNDETVVKFPGIQYKQTIDKEDDGEKLEYKEAIIGTKISTDLLLFKRISIALASSLSSLDIRSFSPALTPMLKSIERKVKEIYVPCENLKDMSESCANIPKIENGVTVKVGRCKMQQFSDEMRLFHFPCKKLNLIDVNFNDLCQLVIKNYHLRKNIRELTIEGNFRSFTTTSYQELYQFAAFLSSSFPNLQNLNVNFSSKGEPELWKWNDGNIMADMFRHLHPGIKGYIFFRIIKFEEYEIDRVQYPNIQESNGEFYQNFSISKTLNFKLASFQDTTISPLDALSERLKEYLARMNELLFCDEILKNELRNLSENWNKKPEKAPKCKNFSIKPIPPIFFKNQRNFKPFRNRFSR